MIYITTRVNHSNYDVCSASSHTPGISFTYGGENRKSGFFKAQCSLKGNEVIFWFISLLL
jgi:hypothetical protein